METRQATHPSQRLLAALTLERLAPEARERTQAHVAHCSTCAEFIARTPREALLLLLRQDGSSRSAADQSTPGDQVERSTVAFTGSPPSAGVPSSGASAPRPGEYPGGVPTPGQPAALPLESLPPELREQTKYRIIRLLGRGGMGSVYEAHHTRMDRKQAIKVINPELVHNPQVLLRFEEEIKAVAKLDHPNIARAYDAESFGSLQAIIMEFVHGQTLLEFLKTRGRLSVMEACRCVRQALLGLQHAHERKITHRDLKPQNLMLTRDTGVIKILDFGLAKVIRKNRQSSGLTKTHVMMGTYEYMAPEQALDAANADIRADIYSLGCTLYYLIAGALPFANDTDVKLLLAHQNETPRPLIDIRPDLPQAVSDLVARMLAKNPADRPQTPAEAARALLPFAKSEAPAPALKSTAAEQTVGNPPRFPLGRGARRLRPEFQHLTSVLRRHRRLATILGLALLGGIIVLAVVLRVRTADGTIALGVSQADAEVLVDGQTITVHWGPDGKSAEITAPPGKHRIEVKKSGFRVSGKEVTIEEGGHEILAVALESNPDKETPSQAKTAGGDRSPPAARDGGDARFVPLFDGKSLKGWSIDGDDKSGWSVADGTIVARGLNIRTRNYLLTDREYSDYVLRFEFNPENGAISGVAVRAIPGESVLQQNGNRSFDHPAVKIFEAPGRQAQTGSMFWVLDVVRVEPNTPATMQPAGSWNRMEISVHENRIRVSVNGSQIVNATLPRGKRFPDGTVPGLGRTKGRIGLEKQRGSVQFRNIEVMELPPPSGDNAYAMPRAGVIAARGVNTGTPAGSATGGQQFACQIPVKQRGSWKIQNGELRGSPAPNPAAQITFGDPAWTDVDFSADIMRTGGDDAIKMFARRGPAAQEYHFLLGGWKNGWCGIYDDAPGRLRGLAFAPFGIDTNRWYAVRIRLRGPSIDCFLDGKKVFYAFDEVYEHGQVGFRIHSDFHIRNIKIARPDGTLLLAGLPDLAQAGDPIRSQTTADLKGSSAPLRFQPSVPTSEVAPQRWRYTTAQPGDNWAKETFDDSKWESGGGGFGVSAPAGPRAATPWNAGGIWLRRDFELSARPERCFLRIAYSGPAEVYINGVLANELPQADRFYTVAGISDEAQAALRRGRNVLAVHCAHGRGKPIIDVGLSASMPNDQLGGTDATNWGEGNPADLLKLVDVATDSITGAWKREGSDVVSPSTGYAQLRIPFTPPSDYRLTIVGEHRDTKEAELNIGLVMGAAQPVVVLDGRGLCNGLALIDGKNADRNPTFRHLPDVLGVSREYTVVCTVHSRNVLVTVNGQTVIDSRFGPERLAIPPWAAIPETDKLFLRTWDSEHQIKRITLVPLSLKPAPK